MNAATKFVAGHSDVMAGVISVKGERFEHFIIAFLVYFKILYVAGDLDCMLEYY